MPPPSPAPVDTRWFFGPTEGWSLEPVARWLCSEGGRALQPVAFVEALVAQLLAAGAPIDRLRIAYRTLHPLLVSTGVGWQRGQLAQFWPGEHGVEQTPAFVGSPMDHVYHHRTAFRRRLDGPLGADEHMVLHELQAEGLRDYIALPLHDTPESIDVLTLATADARGFSDADLERFAALVRWVRPHYERISARDTTVSLLNTYVGRRVGERILQGQVRRGDGERIDAAFWYSDLRRFTELSEALPTDEVLLLLNEYFEQCALAAAPRGGEILQFVGDAILMVFEIRNPGDAARVCSAALDAGLEAFARVAAVNRRRDAEGRPPIRFGLGLHRGTVVHANVGAPDRLSFNVVGPAVNMTARIQETTKLTGWPLLVSAEFAARVSHPLRSIGRYELRGIAKTAELHAPESLPA